MENKRDKLLAALLTLLFAMITVSLLMVGKVSVGPLFEPTTPDEQQQEVFFTDIVDEPMEEIAQEPSPTVDNKPSEASAPAEEASGTDMEDAGKGEEPPVLVSSKTPSEAKTPKPEKTEKQPNPGPTEAEIKEQKAQAIRDKMAKSNFKGQGSGEGTSDNGDAKAGNNKGATGQGLDGRKCIHQTDPGIKNASGTVKVRITVNSAGNVTSATFVSSSGFGDREQEVRDACLKASRGLKYTPDPDTKSASGIVTWRIK